MSIKQKRTLTEKNVAAHRENAQKSRGPVTPEGRQMQATRACATGFTQKTATRHYGPWVKIPRISTSW